MATVEIHILTFHLPYLQYFNERGYEVHVACAGSSDIPFCHVKHNIPFERSPFRAGNLKSFFMLKAILDKNQFVFVHCHTPVGSVVGRLAAAGARRKGTCVLYTAHGFQFYRGGPVKDWLIFYPVEKMLSRFTDILITMNQEDYDMAVRKKFKAGVIEKVDGVGIDLARFQMTYAEKELAAIKASIGLASDSFVLLCVGELSRRKNQAFLLEIIKSICADAHYKMSVKLVLAGPDSLGGALSESASVMGISDAVVFLGYRKDIPQLLAAADIVVSASMQEGLPFNVLEAMSAGKPVVVTDIRGHRDLVRHGVNGFLVKQGDEEAFTAVVKTLYDDKALCRSLGQAGATDSRAFSLDKIMARMQAIYGNAEKRN